MKSKRILCILTGTPPTDPEGAEKFYKWLDDVHIPHLFKFKGIRKATNCRLATDLKPMHTTEASYPDFITMFEFESKEAIQEYAISPERTAATKYAQSIWPPEVGAKKLWSVLYQPIKTVEKKTKTKTKGILFIIAGVPPSDPEDAEKFYKWVDDVHIPQMLEYKGLRKATSYRRVTDIKPLHPTDTQYPDHITIFEFESKEATQEYPASPERATIREDGIEKWGENVGLPKIWSVLYEPIKILER